ncbi:MAG: molybdopterin-dependent oxidoreductase [Planctomycetota bacterium]
MAHALTTCTFCGAGCGIYLETIGNRIIGAYPSVSHPVNQGRLCARGWNVNEVASAPDRLKTPLLKKNGKLQTATWEEAFHFIAERLRQICEQYGPNAIGFLNSPRCSNEETYLLQKFARAVIGTNNVDHGAGVYCNNSLDTLLDMLNVPATTGSIADLDSHDAIIVDNVDLGQQLPTIGGRVIRAKLRGAKLIVIDSRRHRVAEHADFFLQINPGSDALLYGAMAKVIIDRGLMDINFIKNHCRNYDAFLKQVETYDILWAADNCGVPPEQIETVALTYAQARSAALLYSTGAESRSIESIQAMVNMALLSGKIGQNRSGLFALAEQNNLQGVCDMGMLPKYLPGYKLVTDPLARAALESLWQAELPATFGLDADQMLSADMGDRLKALWLCRYDPVSTTIFNDPAAGFKKLELIVLQHLFMTETTPYADVVLPLAAFGEEQITFTNSERRIQLTDKVIEPIEGTLPAWQQIVKVANEYGTRWNYASSAKVMDEIGQAVPAYEGAHYDNLSRDYGRQWPCAKDKLLGTRDLFEDGIRGQPFKFVAIQRVSQAIYHPAMSKPFALIFGRSLYYWHHDVLIRHSETLNREYRVLLLDYPNGFVEINPDDAKHLEARDGAKIKLTSDSGSAITTVRLTNEIKRGMIFVPYFLHEVMQQLLGNVALEAGNRSRPVYVSVEKA